MKFAPVKDIAKADKDARSVYFVAGLAGHVLRYRPLARLLKSKWRMRGIHYPVFLDGSTEVPDIATLARQMRPAVDDGDDPVVIVGYSVGGVFAYEIARELRENGRRAIVVMIDTKPRRLVGERNRRRPPWKKFLLRYARGAQRVFITWPRAMLNVFKTKAKVGAQWVPDEAEVKAFYVESMRAARGYFPPKSDIPIVMIRAVPPILPAWLRGFYRIGRDHGWHLVAPVVGVVNSPGDHLTIAEPENAQMLAESLDKALEIAFAHVN